jgi:hypothetical protein
MAFVINDRSRDTVTFYKKNSFAGVDITKSEYIERGNMNELRYYILYHMDTIVNDQRPDTPHKLIIPRYVQSDIFY